MSFKQTDWDTYAKCYDALNELRPYQDLYRDIISCIARSKPRTILDAACGTGNLALYCNNLPHSKDLHITGVDFSSEMISIAQSKSTHTQNEFVNCDLNNRLQLNQGLFDAIVSINTLYTVKDPISLLKTFHDLLCLSGECILSMPKASFQSGLILKSHAQSIKPDSYWTHEVTDSTVLEDRIDEAISDPITRTQVKRIACHNELIDRHYTSWLSPAQWIDAFHKCGFTIVRDHESYAQQNHLYVLRKKGSEK